MSEIARFDPFLFSTFCELPSHDIELHRNPVEGIFREPLAVLAFVILAVSILLLATS
jgi:hypothetical protein